MRLAALGLLLLALPLRGAEFTGKVISVEDGDTIVVLHGGRRETLRLNGIDCPELGQEFGTRARKFTSDLVYKKEVRVIVEGIDPYLRTLAQVVTRDGKVLNRELVRVGLAWWYRTFAPDNEDLAKLEAEARAAKAGLWGGVQRMPPWFYREALKRKVRPTPTPLGRYRGSRP
jgi:micrococcal nuclease